MYKLFPHSNNREREQLNFFTRTLLVLESLQEHSTMIHIWKLRAFKAILTGYEWQRANNCPGWRKWGRSGTGHYTALSSLRGVSLTRAEQGSIPLALPTPNSQRRQLWLFNTQWWEPNTVTVTHLGWPNCHNIRWITLQKYGKHHLAYVIYAQIEGHMLNARILQCR